MITLSHATIHDARDVAEIQVRSWQQAYAKILPSAFLHALSVDEKEALWKSSIERNRPSLLVAKEQEHMLGWIATGPCRDEDASPQQAEIWAVYVSPDSWGRGVGSQLLKLTSAELGAAGFTTCSLWVLAENNRAKQFYRAHGFEPANEPLKRFELGGVHVFEERWFCHCLTEPQ